MSKIPFEEYFDEFETLPPMAGNIASNKIKSHKSIFTSHSHRKA